MSNHDLPDVGAHDVGAQGLAPLRETELGPLPEGWEIKAIGQVFEIVQGLSLKGNLASGSDGVPFLRTSNIHWGRIDLTNLSRMNVSPEAIGNRWVSRGDLLVCEGGEIGRAAVWESEEAGYTYQNHLHRLRPLIGDSVDPKFAAAWLEIGFCHRMVYEGAGNKTTIPNLSRARLAKLPIPLPPLPEQRAIAEMLRTVDRKIQAEERRKAALDGLFKTLLHHLMTGKVRIAGTINVGAQQRCANVGAQQRCANIGAQQRCAPTNPTTRCAPTDTNPAISTVNVVPGSIGAIVRAFKSATTKRINTSRRTQGAPVWQRNYYEHIIRNGVGTHGRTPLNRIREYILTNPLRWALDRENPQRAGTDEFDLWLEHYSNIREGKPS